MTSSTTATARDAVLDELVRTLPGRVHTTDEEAGPFGRDASRGTVVGRPLGVVTATSTEDVSRALRWASAHGVPVWSSDW
jgi:glycolate oxidase